MTALDWQLRGGLVHLRDNGRLNVLVALILHANIRNRCWPSLDLLCKETGFGLEAVNKAKKWLSEHKAIEVVKYAQRLDEEKALPPRQNVYQLTGYLRIEGEIYRYLYTPNAFNPSATETSATETSIAEGEVVPSLKKIHKKDKTRAASVEARARAVQSSEDTSSVKAIAEQGVTTALTPRSATPPSPVTAPRPRTPGQQANDALVEALRQAWFAGRKRPVQELGKTDFALYLKRAKEMVDGGIPVTEFKLYVEHWHLVSTSKQWDLTLNSLTSNGRMAEYKAFKNYPAMVGTPASAPYDPTRDPAYAPLWNGGKK